MSLIGKLRFHGGRLASWLLGLIFERSWPQHILVYGLTPEARVRLCIEAVRETTLDKRAAGDVMQRVETEAVAPVTLARVREIQDHRRRGHASEEIFEETRRLIEESEYSLAYAYRIYRNVLRWLDAHAGGVQGKRILELGPGHSLAAGALLVAAGAERYVAADYFPLAATAAEHYRRVRAELVADRGLVRTPAHAAALERMLARFDAAVALDGETARFNEKHLSWCCPVDAARLPFEEGSFDVCISNATLEHVRDPGGAARESVRVLAPGGTGFHQIDFRDHRDFANPFDFLRYDARAWEALFDESRPAERDPRLGHVRAPVEYTNRWRKGDFAGAFAAAGAELVSLRADMTAPVDEAARASFDPAFRDRAKEDLEALSAFFVVRK